MADNQLKDIGIVERETVHEQVYNKLCEALLNGQFAPGDTMQIRGLASAVGTSSMPVRDALRTLVAERALVLLPNRTVAVPEPTLNEIDELSVLRCAIEGVMAAGAAKKIHDEEIDNLDKLNTLMHKSIEKGDIKSYLIHNRKFHFIMYNSSGMNIVIEYVKLTWLRVGPIFNYLLGAEWRDNLEHTRGSSPDLLCRNHEIAIQGLRARDPEVVRNAIEGDISECSDYVASILNTKLRASR